MPIVYTTGIIQEVKLLTRLRLNLSHFFLHCPSFIAQRSVFLSKSRKADSNLLNYIDSVLTHTLLTVWQDILQYNFFYFISSTKRLIPSWI